MSILAQVCNTTIWRQRQEYPKFEAGLDYIPNFMIASATEGDPKTEREGEGERMKKGKKQNKT